MRGPVENPENQGHMNCGTKTEGCGGIFGPVAPKTMGDHMRPRANSPKDSAFPEEDGEKVVHPPSIHRPKGSQNS